LWREFDKNSNTLLDVGCGKGDVLAAIKNLAEESNYPLNCYKIGLDLFRPSLENAKRRRIYDELILADARYLPFKSRSIDTVLAFDLIEHLNKSEGKSLIKSLENIACRQVIIFTPVGFLPQQCFEGNPYQEHKSGYSPKDFKRYYIRGIRGIGFITRVGHFYWTKSILGMISLALGLLTQPIAYIIPKIAFQMICIKKLKE
jgi:SAM-dependent methyltransferase